MFIKSTVFCLTNPSVAGVVFKRNASAMIGPATKHISPTEKYALASIMMVALVAYPVYITSNIKNYRAKKE